MVPAGNKAKSTPQKQFIIIISNVRNTSEGVFCNTCNFKKNSTPLQVFLYCFEMRLIVPNRETRHIFAFKRFSFSLRETIMKIEI